MTYITKESALQAITDYQGGAVDKTVAREIIEGLPDAWIPCKPINQYYIRELDDCKDKPYLVTYETKTGRRYVTKVNIYNGFVQRKENRIIAWMPLPEPYKEENNG